MNTLIAEGKWEKVKGILKSSYGQLTDNDLIYVKGKEEELLGRLKEKTGIMQDDIQKIIANLNSDSIENVKLYHLKEKSLQKIEQLKNESKLILENKFADRNISLYNNRKEALKNRLNELEDKTNKILKKAGSTWNDIEKEIKKSYLEIKKILD